MKKRKIPITIICGFLGSGKTTLLNHMLGKTPDHKIARKANTEIVFIGQNMDRSEISGQLESAFSDAIITG